MYYWIDRSHKHEVVTKEIKCVKYGEAAHNEPKLPMVKKAIDPVLADKVSNYLNKKGHKFLFGLQGNQHIITLNLYAEFFLFIPITAESADRILGLITHFLNRPDCLKDVHLTAWIKKNWKLKNNWNKLTSTK